MKEINLTQGQVALVDDEDFETLNGFRWYANKHGNTFYAGRNLRVDGKEKQVYMHQIILNGRGIDHIDHNGLNNQRANLRFCTPRENMMNRQKQGNTSSVYKGVSFHKGTKKWRTTIQINGKIIHVGLYNTEADAARAYNSKAIDLFCEFANLNIIP